MICYIILCYSLIIIVFCSGAPNFDLMNSSVPHRTDAFPSTTRARDRRAGPDLGSV